jgi:hypothetical protein
LLGSLDYTKTALMNGQLEWPMVLIFPMRLVRFWIPMDMILLSLNWLLKLSQGLVSIFIEGH